MTWADLLRQCTQTLAEAGVADPARDARRLMALARDVAPDRIGLDLGDTVDLSVRARLLDLTQERARRRPMAQILGTRDFYRHSFLVTEAVLDPRPETEILVDRALEAPFESVLDLGTGSGCILLSLLAARPAATGVGTDLSRDALQLAVQNARRLDLSDRAVLVHSDWFAEVMGRFDLIVSNPPYIALDEMPGLAPELAFEPEGALTDGGDGLSAYRAIAVGARGHLAPGGRLMVEIGPTQTSAVSDIFTEAGLRVMAVHCDLDGRERVISAANRDLA